MKLGFPLQCESAADRFLGICGRTTIVTCEKCGADVAEGLSVCPQCEFPVSVEQIGPVYVPPSAQAPEVIPAIPELAVTRKQQVYAGFWLRAAAFAVDTLIVSFLTVLIAALHPSAFFRSLDPNLFMQSPLSILTPLGIVLFTVPSWFYGTLFESSLWQATPGKRLLGIYATDLHGRRLTFARASFRNLVKQLPGFFFFGYFLAGLTSRKQALHDILASSLILRSARS